LKGSRIHSFITKLFFDADKLGQVWGAAKTMLSIPIIWFGVSFFLLAIIILNIIYKIFLFLSADEAKRKETYFRPTTGSVSWCIFWRMGFIYPAFLPDEKYRWLSFCTRGMDAFRL